MQKSGTKIKEIYENTRAFKIRKIQYFIRQYMHFASIYNVKRGKYSCAGTHGIVISQAALCMALLTIDLELDLQ
jgi:hypothetical protein